jgi:hypothetical protein
MLITHQSFSQSGSNILSARIADKMKDSLMLTMNQRNQIFNINIQLQNQKSSIRYQNYQGDTTRKKTQIVENSRDSLYNLVLSNQQFILYQQKKRYLISNN